MARKKSVKENSLNDEIEIVMSAGGSIYDSDTLSNHLDGFIVENTLFIPFEGEVHLPYISVGMHFHNSYHVAALRKAAKDKDTVFFFVVPEGMPKELGKVEPWHVHETQGAIGEVEEIHENPDGTAAVLVKLSHQASILNVRRRVPYLRGDVKLISLPKIPDKPMYHQEQKTLKDIYTRMISHLNEEDRQQIETLMSTIPEESVLELNFMIQNSPLTANQRYYLLTQESLEARRAEFIRILKEEEQTMGIRAEIHAKTLNEIGNRQREDFLRTQMRQIQEELGDSEDSDINELNARAEKKKWNAETGKAYEKELRKLQRFNPNSPEYAIQYSYLDTFVNLPWNELDESEISLDKIETILNRDHYGLEKIKERIVEQMAVMKLNNSTKAPILCLYGPPGVGKTSLGKSVAEALGRKYERVALGGVHDEAEIRGHRRTYLGSMPGRIMAAIEKCGSCNPVIVLDEIDKIGADFKGDPSTALLEVLDPEQNCKFHDNYIDHDFDLSKVLFITTANSLSGISTPLLDRMELIEIGGYVDAEKIEISKRHLIPRNLKEHGFDETEISFTDDALRRIIDSYTRESGVRRLEKKINNVLRKIAKLKASGKKYPKKITPDIVSEYLGSPEVFPDMYEGNDIPGVVTGLAWTQAGGEILFIETSLAPGKESKLALTGNLGDVMKESATLALQYVKANYKKIGIPEEALTFGTLHVHVPEGAVPKDGPSAGIAIVTSIASTFTNRKVREGLALTGEITLRGKVLPVGGIKEKILAAKRAGITTVMLSEKNRKDIEEIKPEYISGLDFHYVNTIDEVLEFALI